MAKRKKSNKEPVGVRLRRYFRDHADHGKQIAKVSNKSWERWQRRNAELKKEVKRVLDRVLGPTYLGFDLEFNSVGQGGATLLVWIKTVDVLHHLRTLHRELHVDSIQVRYHSRVRWPS